MEPTSTGVDKWLNIISQYDNEFKKWEARAAKIVKRYRDDNRSQHTNETAKFNILWSNVQTLIPAVYAKLPKAVAQRRFGDNDPVGRVAGSLIERALDFEIEHYPDFRATMKHAVEDRFLGGRGTAWVRYEPHVRQLDMPEDGLQITEDVENESAEGQTPEGAPKPENQDYTAGETEPQEEIEYECAPTDYVYWKDFGHSVARTWEEVTCVWRWVYMTKEALTERFGEKMAKSIPLDSGAETLATYGQSTKERTRAKICELWDKESGKVYWLSKNHPTLIDERDDPLELDQFFPCARPLYSTTTSDSLIPVPDFVIYQDQANELDILSDRIDGLVKALRIRGVYDASQPALQRLLTEGDNNSLIPVDKWMAFSEKGGLKGSIDILPIDMLASALLNCYRAREDIKGQIYEITGISDIIRGQTSASETATAQQIKGQYAGLRLRSMQEEVALFASELIRLKAQVICTKFQPQTILLYAAAGQMSQEDQQMIPQAIQLMQDNPLRNFRIEVDADSLVQIDEQQTKKDRVEFLTAFGGFMRESLPVGQQSPELVPMLVELIKFGIGGFKQAKPIEGVLDVALEQMKQKQAGPQEQKPDPEMMKMQAQQQSDQMRVQADTQSAQAKMQADMQMTQAKAQADMQVEQMKMQHAAQLEQQKLQFEGQLKNMEMQAAKERTELEAATKIMVARIGANPGLDIPMIEAQQAASEKVSAELGENVKMAIDHMAQMHENMANMHGETMNRIGGVMQTLAAPKRIVRGPDGKAVGVEVAA
jgi:F0F1-type ATP synthase membrane subunit b/b'